MIKVSVIVITYNQEAYIDRTLDHIAAQERDFEIEVVIGEDGSTDGTRAVCEDYVRRYPYMRLMPQAPNKGILRNYLDCLFECRGEYVAGCGGDDFWHDNQKLKVQTEFLDTHSDYGVVHGAVLKKDGATGAIREEKLRVPSEGDVSEKIYFEHIVEAPTVCFRRSLAENYIDREEWLRRGFLMEDLPMWIAFANVSKFKFIPRPLTTYTIWGDSACRGDSPEKRLRFIESARDVRLYFYDKLHPEFARRRIIRKYKRRVLRLFWGSGDRKMFWQKAREFGFCYSLVVALGEKIKGR